MIASLIRWRPRRSSSRSRPKWRRNAGSRCRKRRRTRQSRCVHWPLECPSDGPRNGLANTDDPRVSLRWPPLPAQLLLEGATRTSKRESRMAKSPLDDASDDDEEMSPTHSTRRRDPKAFAGPSLHRQLSSASLSSIFGSLTAGDESPAIGRRGLSTLSSASQHLAHLDTVPGSRDHLDDLRASRSHSHQPAQHPSVRESQTLPR